MEPVQKVWEQLWDDIRALASWTESLDTDLLRVDELPVEVALTQLEQLREVVRSLRVSETAYERWIAAVFKDQKWGFEREIPLETGVAVKVTVNRSKGRKGWKHRDLLTAWYRAWLRKRGNPSDPTPVEVRNALFEAVGIGYWKVSVLRDLDIDPDEFSNQEPGPPKIQIEQVPL
jgi:hypothetical protein